MIAASSAIRPKTLSARAVRRSVMIPGISASGCHTSVLLGNLNPSAITPATIDGVPLMRIARPTIDGSLL